MRRICSVLALAVFMVASLAVEAGAGAGNEDPVKGPACLDIRDVDAGYSWVETDDNKDDGGETTDPLRLIDDDYRDDNYWTGTLVAYIEIGQSPDPICQKAKYLLYVTGTSSPDLASPYLGQVQPANSEGRTLVYFPGPSAPQGPYGDSPPATLASVNENDGGREHDLDRKLCIRFTSTVGNSTFDYAPNRDDASFSGPTCDFDGTTGADNGWDEIGDGSPGQSYR